MENPARKTTFDVIKNLKKVKINCSKIKQLSEDWSGEQLGLSYWPKKMHLETKNQEKMIDYLIILDAVNFCFWSKKEKWHIFYNNKKYDGYFALSLALKEFFEKNPKKGNLKYFQYISFEEFKDILRGGKNLLFLKKRWEITRKVSQSLVKKYKNSKKFVNSAKKKTSRLIEKIYKELPFFDDISEWRGKKIYFLKRPQILVVDIWAALEGKGLGRFDDLDYPTAFADYKVPQILNNFGILEYSSDLKQKIRNRVLIPKGSKEEIEIRGAAIWAVEYFKEVFKQRGRDLHSFQIDWLLWNKAQKIEMEIPYHLTKTIFY